MLKKLKITSCVFILCLFGLTLMTVSPVLAEDSTEFQECQRIKPNGTSFALMKEKKDCFRDLARELSAANLAQEPLIEKSTDTASQLLAPNAEQENLSVKISDLEGKLANALESITVSESQMNFRLNAIKAQQAELTKANKKILDLEADYERQKSEAIARHRSKIEQQEEYYKKQLYEATQRQQHDLPASSGDAAALTACISRYVDGSNNAVIKQETAVYVQQCPGWDVAAVARQKQDRADRGPSWSEKQSQRGIEKLLRYQEECAKKGMRYENHYKRDCEAGTPCTRGYACYRP